MRVVQPPPGPMPTLMPSAPRSTQEPRAFGRRDVAGNHLDVAEALAELRHARSMTTEWPCAMSMTMTSTSGANELGRALEIVAGRADRRADAQPPALVAGRERQAPLPQQVARGDQPAAGGRRHRRAEAS